MNLIKKLFPHKHKFECVDFVYHSSKFNELSAMPSTAKIYKCKCGKENRTLTDAGWQQLSWGDDLDELLGLK